MPRLCERVGRQYGVRFQPEAFGDRLITGVANAFDVDQVQPWLADAVPRTQGAFWVVEHEQAGCEHFAGVGVVWRAGKSVAREICRVCPALLREANTCQFAIRSRRLGTLFSNGQKQVVGGCDTLN